MKSFLDRVRATPPAPRIIPWPGRAAEGESPRVALRVLSRFEFEAAHLETVDHFRALQKARGSKGGAVDTKSEAFSARERTALLFLALRDGDNTNAPIAAGTDDLDLLPPEILNYLWVEWQSLQCDQFAAPESPEDLEKLIEGAKKDGPSGALVGLPLTTLYRLLRSMGSRLSGLEKGSSGT